MRSKRVKTGFWNKLLTWGEVLEATSSDYPRNQLVKLSMELDEVSHRLRVIEGEETTRHEGCRS